VGYAVFQTIELKLKIETSRYRLQPVPDVNSAQLLLLLSKLITHIYIPGPSKPRRFSISVTK